MSVLNRIISYYPSKNATGYGKDVSLLKLLESQRHKEKILQLRDANHGIQKQLKENLPGYTVAGRFCKRCDEGLLELSGLAAIDLDSADQYDAPYLLKHLRQDLECIAYAGFSCRGTRLFAIVPFLYPEKYHRHYERLIKSFQEYNLPMGDDCHKCISQLRFVSWNEKDKQFFRHDAIPYKLLAAEKLYYHQPRFPMQPVRSSADINPFAWCIEQISKTHSFVNGSRHKFILRVARYCNLKGLPKDQTLNGCLSYQQPDFDEKEISKIVKHVYKKQVISHNKLPFITKVH